jgi:hypothetical protein
MLLRSHGALVSCPVQIAPRAAESPLPSIRTRLSVRRQATHSRFREAPQRAIYTVLGFTACMAEANKETSQPLPLYVGYRPGI